MQMIDPKAGSNRLYVSDFVIEQMQRIPTIDAVPVVRCKDCQSWQEIPWSNGEMVCKCWADWLPTGPDDFCSCGERKDGEG